MKRAATLLTLAVLLASSAAQMAASTGTTSVVSPSPYTPIFKLIPPTTRLNFTVTDDRGALLTCAKQQIDTDILSGCVLAPGRTLDDLMTTIVQAVHAEQEKNSEDK